MPRALKTDKFFFYKPSRIRRHTRKVWLIGVNHSFAGDRESITLKDLLDALAAHGIDPEKVHIGTNFITTAKP